MKMVGNVHVVEDTPLEVDLLCCYLTHILNFNGSTRKRIGAILLHYIHFIPLWS